MTHRSFVSGLTFTALMAFNAPLAAQLDRDYSSPGQPLEQPLNLTIDYRHIHEDAEATDGRGKASKVKPDRSGIDMSESFGTWVFSPVILGRRQNGTNENATHKRALGLELRRTF